MIFLAKSNLRILSYKILTRQIPSALIRFNYSDIINKMPPKKKAPSSPEIKEDSQKKVKVSTQAKLTSFGSHSQAFPTDNIGKIPDAKIKITSWNINGLNAVTKKGELQKYLNQEQPDILCLNEIKCGKDKYIKENLEKVIPKGWNEIWNYSMRPGYSGVAIFSKFKPASVKLDLGISKHDQESRTLTAEFEKFYLVACYVPNAGQGLKRLSYRVKEWDQDFMNYLTELGKKKPVILTGDLNCAHKEIDIANPKSNLKSAGFTVEERAEFGKLLETGFVDTFREMHPTDVKYSYFSNFGGARAKNVGWRLDYFLVSKKIYEKGAVLESDINTKVYGSDHVPIEMTLDVSLI